jgi:misacylated tRNA(Ala) deacylase
MLVEDANHWVNKDAEIMIHEWSRKQIMSDDRVRNRRFVERIIDRIGGSDPILRMVEIEGIDLCPCAGTHLSSTSSIGNITIGRVQNKGKGTFRIYFEI